MVSFLDIDIVYQADLIKIIKCMFLCGRADRADSGRDVRGTQLASHSLQIELERLAPHTFKCVITYETPPIYGEDDHVHTIRLMMGIFWRHAISTGC